tara:strand:- start:989 stop:1387 length:399 start_codon:yes stop_codon:yes gene_type:complete
MNIIKITLKVKNMEKDKCDFCEQEKPTVVGSVDYAPASLEYCEDCEPILNIRPLYNALHNWIRKGDSFLTEKTGMGVHPSVYHKGLYMLFSTYVDKYLTKKQKEYLFETPYYDMSYSEYRKKILETIKITRL